LLLICRLLMFWLLFWPLLLFCLLS